MAEKSNAAKEENKDVPEVKPKPGLPPMVIKIAIMVGILIVLAVGAFAVVTFVIAPKLRAQASTEEVQAGEADAEHGTGGHEEDKDKEKGKEHAAHGEIVALGDIVVNPAGTGGRRYLKAGVSVEVKDPKVAKLVEHRSAALKDLLVRELSSRGLDELTDPASKEEMREAIVEQLSEHFPPGSVLNVYFTEYVIQ